jgi:hypothetical protein
MQRFTDYADARRHAQDKANALGLNVGIERTREFGKDGYCVRILPGADRRSGSELRCEVVTPESVQ